MTAFAINKKQHFFFFGAALRKLALRCVKRTEKEIDRIKSSEFVKFLKEARTVFFLQKQ